MKVTDQGRDRGASRRRRDVGVRTGRRAMPGLLVVGAAVALASGPAAGASLQDEIAHLLKTNPQIKAARNNSAAAGEGINRAFADYLPRVTVTGDYGWENTSSPGLRGARNGRDLHTPRETLSVSVTENVFDGFRTTTNNRTARLTKTVADIAIDSTQQNVLFEGVAAYLNVLRHDKLVELAAGNAQTIQRQLQLEDERVRRGAGISVDVLQAKSRLQIAKERRVAFEGNLENAITRYIQVFDRQPVIGAMGLPPLPLGQIPSSLDEAERIAVAENPATANSARATDVAVQRKRSAKSGFYPQLDVVAEYNYENDEAGVIGTRRDYSVKLQANWQLFTGFSTRAESAEAAYQYLASIDNGVFVGRKIVEDVRLSWEQLATARARVKLLQNAVNIASEVHDARRKLREAGKDTVINVLDAENEVFNAQINATDAEYDARIAVYRLNLALGRLRPELLIQTAMVDPAASIAKLAAPPAPQMTEPAATTAAMAPAVEPPPPPAPAPVTTAAVTTAVEPPPPPAPAAPAVVEETAPAPVTTAAVTPAVEPPPPPAPAAPAVVEETVPAPVTTAAVTPAVEPAPPPAPAAPAVVEETAPAPVTTAAVTPTVEPPPAAPEPPAAEAVTVLIPPPPAQPMQAPPAAESGQPSTDLNFKRNWPFQ